MFPLAPGRLSTTNDCPSASDSRCAYVRAITSMPPPGANPTTIRTVLTGYAGLAGAGVCANVAFSHPAHNASADAYRSFTIACSLLRRRFVPTADRRLAPPKTRQFPHTRAAGIQVAADVGVDHARFAAR